jgi:type III pantothenate kinase
MKLLVDIGNSRVKWAFAEQGQLTARGEAIAEPAKLLESLVDKGYRANEIRIASVADAAAGAAMAARLAERFHVTPVMARSAERGAGVRNGYRSPRQLGIDRWLAVCAAFTRFRNPLCVVDAGTATTVDLVTAGGDHEGGLILPGIDLMLSTLLARTANLARLSIGDGDFQTGHPADAGSTEPAVTGVLLGRDTAAAIRLGAEQATAGLVWACMTAFSARLAPASAWPVLVLTGGSAPALEAGLRRLAGPAGPGPFPGRVEYRPDLVLEGLALEPPCFAAD